LDVLLREFGALLPITGSWSYKILPLPKDDYLLPTEINPAKVNISEIALSS
jgi:hypothetical protein